MTGSHLTGTLFKAPAFQQPIKEGKATRSFTFLLVESTMASSIREWLRSLALGCGSFGTVSLAINLNDGALFAVKSVPCSFPSPSAELRAIENELDILRSLDSPRILRCLGSDFSIENGVSTKNIFLEYVAGGSIADLVKQSGGKLDEKRVRVYARGILEGLHYLHEQGIVHCDIKGRNILVGSSGVKIADFGAAKSLRSFKDEENRSQSAAFGGTPLWMAPEVVQGVEQGPPSDIWSFGCTVVEMLQGNPPWNNFDNLAAVLFQIGCSGENPPLPECASPDARDFLQRCLQRDPRARWTTAQLLEHPFVKMDSKSHGNSHLCDDCLSPRSALDFSYDRDSEDEATNSVPILCQSRKVGKRSVKLTTVHSQEAHLIFDSAVDTPEAVCSVSVAPSIRETIPSSTLDWITALRADGWSEDRQKPFMEVGDQNLVMVRSGSEMNLESISFLRKRRYLE